MNAPVEPAPQTSASSAEQQASGSSFYAAMRLLPPPERAAMFAVYGFCRVVDDIADEPGPSDDQRRKELGEWRDDLAALYAGRPPPRIDYLVEPMRRFGLKQEDFLAIVDGMEMDVGAPIRGMDDQAGPVLAHHLGRALQLTNILRDLDEDADMGRLYIPAEALEAAGIETREPHEVVADPRLDIACRWVAAKAHEHYAEADAILSAMEKAGWAAPRHRISLPKTRLLWIVLRHGLVD